MNRAPPVAGTPSLRDAVDLGVLECIQDTFARAMGFAAVTVDRSGTPITRDTSFLRICRTIRSTEAGFARCCLCDAEGGLHAQQLRGPAIYTCRSGLLDIAAPIVIQGEYLRCILYGQVVPSTAHEEHVFLFNPQAVLSYSAIREKAPETEEITYCLSDLLRNSLRRVTSAVTLGQEMETITLGIQNVVRRLELEYGSAFDIRIESEVAMRRASCSRSLPAMGYKAR